VVEVPVAEVPEVPVQEAPLQQRAASGPEVVRSVSRRREALVAAHSEVRVAPAASPVWPHEYQEAPASLAQEG
jgi:hypothetical protein